MKIEVNTTFEKYGKYLKLNFKSDILSFIISSLRFKLRKDEVKKEFFMKLLTNI